MGNARYLRRGRISKSKEVLKVSEIFPSIQGEGRYVGTPVVFLRLSGCTRDCWFCDEKRHKKGECLEIQKIVDKIQECRLKTVVVTGGEPLLQKDALFELMLRLGHLRWYSETNGDWIEEEKDFLELVGKFDYVCISPKEEEVAQRVWEFRRKFPVFRNRVDIKIVTDLYEVGMELIPYATMLMPLSVKKEKENIGIRRRVWKFCVDNELFYSPRLQVEVWGYGSRL